MWLSNQLFTVGYRRPATDKNDVRAHHCPCKLIPLIKSTRRTFAACVSVDLHKTLAILTDIMRWRMRCSLMLPIHSKLSFIKRMPLKFNSFYLSPDNRRWFAFRVERTGINSCHISASQYMCGAYFFSLLIGMLFICSFGSSVRQISSIFIDIRSVWHTVHINGSSIRLAWDALIC